jgi:CRP-like cAMP-binding protein
MLDIVNLKRIELFKGLEDESLEVIASFCEQREFDANATLFRADEAADEMFVLLSGRVVLTVPISVFMVEREMQIESKGPGELLGWSGLVPPHKYTLTATAAEPGEVIAIGSEALLRYCEEHPDGGYTIMSNVARIIGDRLAQVKALLLKEVERSIRLV